jgi:hypothetical protein
MEGAVVGTRKGIGKLQRWKWGGGEGGRRLVSEGRKKGRKTEWNEGRKGRKGKKRKDGTNGRKEGRKKPGARTSAYPLQEQISPTSHSTYIGMAGTSRDNNTTATAQGTAISHRGQPFLLLLVLGRRSAKK